MTQHKPQFLSLQAALTVRHRILCLLLGLMLLLSAVGCSDSPVASGSSESGSTTASGDIGTKTSGSSADSAASSSDSTAPDTSRTEPSPSGTTAPSADESGLTAEQLAAFLAQEHTYLQYTAGTDSSVTAAPSSVSEDGSFFDDFADGIDPAIWNIVQQKWGAGNNGVKRDHISYTADGAAVFAAYGDYYKTKSLRRSGACLATRRPLGPGSFEVRMKVLPRMGSCTAMWTYYNDGTRNHEIDIELPGNTRSFRYSLFTNWLTEQTNSSQYKYPDFAHNDGEWHTYRFDWHTDQNRIDYYIDGKLEASATKNIPTVATYFWLGVWFPKDWCGTPDFDTAYMLVDWVRYTAYDESHETTQYGFDSTPKSAYPSEPVSLPVNNYAADGGFEHASAAWSLSGEASYAENPQRRDTLLHAGRGGSASQIISSINSEAAYRISLTAASLSAGSKAQIRVECLGQLGDRVLPGGTFTWSCDSTALSVFSKAFTTVQGTYRLRVTLSNEGDGDAYFDDLYLTQPSRGDFVLA